MGAVPRSLKYLNKEDKEGNQLWVITVMAHTFDNYLQECRKNNITVRKFVYDYEKYKNDLHQKTILETSYEQKRVMILSNSCRVTWQEDAISLSVSCSLPLCT